MTGPAAGLAPTSEAMEPMGAPAPAVAVFERVAQSYETVGPAFFDHFGALLVEHTGVRPGERVVDLACGTGAVTVPALAAVGSSGSVLALDLAQGMVDRLRRHVAGVEPVEVQRGDAADPQLPAGSVDVLLCGFALFFLPNPPTALEGWRAALRPGGRLGLSTWARPGEAFVAVRVGCERLGAQMSGGGQAFDDAHVLTTSLREAGLVDVQVLTVALDLVLADVTELLRWCGTHGARAWLDQLDATAFEQLYGDLRRQWPGAVPMTWHAHLAVGTRPPATSGHH